ncbi:MAG: CoA-binding protein [Candidatus Dojkabacteria bacterium]|uniref:riboflavin kinase n=2 Tax=Candidatus Dojkabacteria TaxID=74243 RepID=A0A136KKE2_9BACT|nr:MAG: RNA-binding riboflavin kinase RibR [candidate division WS6 bacterium OLB21]MBW7953873.1 CoA-binding protein [Candidatus Dojkabacteria bacterium]WKZ28000.1 MAG: CoA-binding protein [Candidatus Dojkabacteria bacterium]
MNLKRAFSGYVIAGERLGSKIGYPTINFDPEIISQSTRQGVWAASVVVDGDIYLAALYFGPKYVGNKSELVLEINILEYSGSIYKKRVRVELLKFVREPIKYDDISLLREQIGKDIKHIELITGLLSRENIYAVVGVSLDTAKYGYRVYKSMSDAGINVSAVNPKYSQEQGIKFYNSVADLNDNAEVIVFVVPPAVAENIIHDNIEVLRNKLVWFQPGSESENASKLCEVNHIDYVLNKCVVVDGLSLQLR